MEAPILEFDAETNVWNVFSHTTPIGSVDESPVGLNWTLSTLQTLDEIHHHVNPPSTQPEVPANQEVLNAASTLCEILGGRREPRNDGENESTNQANEPRREESEQREEPTTVRERVVIGMVQLEGTGDEANNEAFEDSPNEGSDANNNTKKTDKEDKSKKQKDDAERGNPKSKKRPRSDESNGETLKCTACCKKFKQARYLVAHVRKSKCPAQDVNRQGSDDTTSEQVNILQCRRCGEMGDEQWLSTHDYKRHSAQYRANFVRVKGAQ